jgi:hypothetical protein
VERGNDGSIESIVDMLRCNCHNAIVKRSSLWLLPLLLAVMVGGSFYFDRQAAKGDRELNVYVTGGQRMAAGEEIYRRGLEGKPFTYPPFAAVPFVPFAKLPAAWHPSAWFLVNLLILAGMIRWLHRYARGSETGRSPPKLWLFWLLTAVFGGRHVVSVFTNQSHDLTIAGLVMMTAVSWCGHKRFSGMWAGVWAGLGAATKATPLIFLGLFGLRLHWLGLIAIVGVTIGATVLPDYMFPRADGMAWWRSWYDVNLAGLKLGGTAEAAGAWNSHSVQNQGLSGAIRRLFTAVEVPDGSFVVGDKGHVLLFEMSATMTKVATLLMSGLVLGLIAMCVVYAKRAVRAAGDGMANVQRTLGLGEVGAFACGMVLLSPQSSKAHFCVWLFPVAFVVNYLTRNRRDVIAIMLFSVALILGMLSKGVLGKPMANVVLAYGSVAWSTFFLLLATGRCLQVASRSHDG